jgi:biphenyl-2,3-diol 1,2-dioxygenase
MKPLEAAMQHDLEVGYLEVELPDPAALSSFLSETIGLMAGPATASGGLTWRNDHKVHRLIVKQGSTGDATVLGFEAANVEAFAAHAQQLTRAGYTLVDGTPEEISDRKVADLKYTTAPWGVRVELVHALADADDPLSTPLVPAGFLTEGVGFGHAVFATTNLEESHAFLVNGLGMAQSDWIETELMEGVDLEVRFYHCNERHHSVALAQAPFELPQRLHHLMVETMARDDVGSAFDRAWNSGLGIANGLGRHANDGMFSFYVISPAGFQVEVGYGARLITEPWNENWIYDQISLWGHQPVVPG